MIFDWLRHIFKRSPASSSEEGALVMIFSNRVVRIKDCREGEGEVFAFHHESMLVRGTMPAIDRWQAAGCPMDGLDHTHDDGVFFIDDGWRLPSA